MGQKNFKKTISSKIEQNLKIHPPSNLEEDGIFLIFKSKISIKKISRLKMIGQSNARRVRLNKKYR
jgi:hypothetical protein